MQYTPATSLYSQRDSSSLYPEHGFKLVARRLRWDPLVFITASSIGAVKAVLFARWLKLCLGGFLLLSDDVGLLHNDKWSTAPAAIVTLEGLKDLYFD
jgi:hypothetical protein